MNTLEEIEAIKKLKYRYFRYVDCKQFVQLVDLFVDGASTSYDSGRHAFTGKDAILEFFEQGLSNPKILSQHQGHHPEIELTGESSATGIWYMEDTVYILEHQMKVRGNGIYWDEYAKVDGDWKISHTGYERIWEYTEVVPETTKREFKSIFDAQERQRRSERVKRDSEPELL